MWLAEALQTSRSDAFGKPQKPRLHVGWKGRDFGSDRLIEDFDSPSHRLLYLIYEIKRRRST